MGFTWIESLLYGLVSGMTDILPVSAQAHRQLLLKLYGESSDLDLMMFFIHVGILAAVYFHCQPHIVRILRAKRLSRIPKRRRKRPLDTKSLMDFSLWKTMLVPVILSFFLFEKAQLLETKLVWVAVFILINGLILYLPQFFPGSNKDSRSLSRVEGLMMGLGGAISILPGLSAMGSAISVGSICGVERGYSLTMGLLMNIASSTGLIVVDVKYIIAQGLFGYRFNMILNCVLGGVGAFAGTYFGIKIMRYLAEDKGYSVFAYYCWGLALFTFVLNLMA